MLDDAQFAQFLTMNELVEPDQLDVLQMVAEEAEQPLYLTVIENQAVPEEVLVGLLSQVMNVNSVSLNDFDADPAVLRRLPASLARDLGVLPVGTGSGEHADVLYVAMANPHDTDALARIRAMVSGRVEPLLAGPIDLLRAIERAYQQRTPTAEHDLDELSAQMLRDATASDDPETAEVDDASILEDTEAAIDDVFDDFYEQPAGEVISALSLLDDIPRDRHEHDTSPNVLSMIEGLPEPRRRAETSADNSLFPSFDDDAPPKPPAPRGTGLSGLFGSAGSHASESQPGARADELSEEESGLRGVTGLGKPAPRISGSFQRVSKREPSLTPSAHDAPTVDTAGIGPLSRAAIQVLLRKGIITEEELNEELLRHRR